MTKTQEDIRFVICIDNTGAEDLEKGKVYRLLPDESAAKSDYLRVVDESGEDYLYPGSCFVFLDLPDVVKEALLA